MRPVHELMTDGSRVISQSIISIIHLCHQVGRKFRALVTHPQVDVTDVKSFEGVLERFRDTVTIVVSVEGERTDQAEGYSDFRS